MSFSSTPLGQARRLDRDTFLGKAKPNGNRPPSPRRLPTSYALGTPITPARPSSPIKDPNHEESYENEPALARFARLKQREAATNTNTSSLPGAPKTFTSPPNPTGWVVKDTSVNIASAFNQAATSSLNMSSSYNPNHAWASTSRTATQIPRSTSVEYERAASGARRLPSVGGRVPLKPTSNSLKPPSQTRSLQHVPDSEGEELHIPGGRAKSPLNALVEAARTALDPAVFYVRQRLDDSTDSHNSSTEQAQPSTNGARAGNDSSYNYEEEERFVQSEQEKERRSKVKKGRISVDNQAWKPGDDDDEYSDDDVIETERRKRGKNNPAMRGLTGLPTVATGKTTKKRRKGAKGNFEDDGAYSDDQESFSRNSMPPPRISVEPTENPDYTMDKSEQGLGSIPEVPEDDIAAAKAANARKPRKRSRSRSRGPTPVRSQRFSIGGLLGTLTHAVVSSASGFLIFIVKILASCLYLFGRVLGAAYAMVIHQPYLWVTGSQSGVFSTLVKYLVLGLTISAAWYALRNPAFTSYLPSLPSFPTSKDTPAPIFTPPSAPISNLDELVDRLSRIEAALSSLSSDNAKIKLKTEDSTRYYGDLLERLGSVEGRINAEARRISDTESRARDTLGKNLNSVKQEVELLQARIEAQRKQDQIQREKERKEWESHKPVAVPEVVSDAEARARLKALEERVGTVEGGVQQAIELGKKAASAPPAAPPAPAPSQGAAWWSKVLSKSGNKEGLRITTPDGQDVTGLITHLVDNAVSVISKDGLAKPDFALHSAGGRVIPSLTSPTFEIKPSTLRGVLFGALTGNGYAIGHPPVTALEPSLHAGRCWPLTGTTGQLGVALASPAYIEEITIDHVAKEVAFDMRTAPRQMEVWGLVEGQDNIVRLREHRQRKIAARREALEAQGEVLDADWERRELEKEREGYPLSLPRNPEYLRIAKFTYDIHAAKHVQTFAVDEEVKEMGLDFGVVVARVLNNWGHEAYTCLYRLRVHGKRFGDLPPPYEEKEEGTEAQ